MADSLSTEYPDLKAAMISNKTPTQPPYNRLVTLTSSGGVQMQNFAKYKKWDKGEVFTSCYCFVHTRL
jgi:hypothetical protein